MFPGKAIHDRRALREQIASREQAHENAEKMWQWRVGNLFTQTTSHVRAVPGCKLLRDMTIHVEA